MRWCTANARCWKKCRVTIGRNSPIFVCSSAICTRIRGKNCSSWAASWRSATNSGKKAAWIGRWKSPRLIAECSDFYRTSIVCTRPNGPSSKWTSNGPASNGSKRMMRRRAFFRSSGGREIQKTSSWWFAISRRCCGWITASAFRRQDTTGKFSTAIPGITKAATPAMPEACAPNRFPGMAVRGPSSSRSRRWPRFISSPSGNSSPLPARFETQPARARIHGTFLSPLPYLGAGRAREASKHAKRNASDRGVLCAGSNDEKSGANGNGGASDNGALPAREGGRLFQRRERECERATCDGGGNPAHRQSWLAAQRPRDHRRDRFQRRGRARDAGRHPQRARQRICHREGKRSGRARGEIERKLDRPRSGQEQGRRESGRDHPDEGGGRAFFDRKG